MNPSLTALQTRLGYTFKDENLLVLAVTHPSYANEHPAEKETNQRLEFLGDSVLQLIITEELFRLYPADREGDLSNKRFALVKGLYLCRLAREIGLPACLRLSASEAANGGAERDSILEDAFEALIAAIHLDGGMDRAREITLRIYGDLPPRLARVVASDNPKGRLQELVQPLHGNSALRYEVVNTGGQAHAREFEVTLFLKDQPLASGRGTSKQRAEEAAARAALASWPPTGSN